MSNNMNEYDIEYNQSASAGQRAIVHSRLIFHPKCCFQLEKCIQCLFLDRNLIQTHTNTRL